MSRKLGIFIDYNSIGWTLVQRESNRIIDLGVHVFPSGCENFGRGKSEVSKKHSRRLIRMRRVRYSRIRTRKFYLLRILTENDMCPLSLEELKRWKEKKIFPSESLHQWLKLNPYELRKKGLHNKISLHEFGRIFYQISCHRGYRYGERNVKLKESVLSEGIPSEGKIGYVETSKQLKDKTLGEYLYTIQPKEGKSYSYSNTKIRNRVCTVEMYFKEIHLLWEKQSTIHPSLNEELREELIGSPTDFDPRGALFFQRGLKSQKYKVGNCVYEPNKTRCSISSLEYQELEALKWINTIEVHNQPLSCENREKVLLYYNTHFRFKFFDIKKILELDYSDHFNYRDEEVFRGSFINSEMSKAKFFGMKWFEFDQKTKEDIYHALYFFNSRKRLEDYAQTKLGLNGFSASEFSRINLDKNYAPVSKKACRNILIFLRQGYRYSEAVYLAGIKNALGRHWKESDKTEQNQIVQFCLNIKNEVTQSRLVETLVGMLSETFHFKQFNPDKLYGFTNLKVQQKLADKFQIDKGSDRVFFKIKNTLLMQSMFETRKIINELVDRFGAIDEIACEISVDLKVNRIQRFMFKVDQNRIRNNNTRYVEILKERRVDLLPINILKLNLWEECKKTCPYTGKKISYEELFSSDIQVVYIHPWRYSMSDSILNKTLCFSYLADQLDDRTPFDYFTQTGIKSWEEVKKRAAYIFSNTTYHPGGHKKFKRFIKKYNHRDILKKQFSDVHVLSRAVGGILRQVSPKVNMMPGNITQHFIREWLLMNAFKNKSEMFDYRVRVLRAYVNAVCQPEHIIHLAGLNRYVRQKRDRFPTPSEDYLEHLSYKVNSLLVSHKKHNRLITHRNITTNVGNKKIIQNTTAVRGLLHKETLYGQRKPPDSIEGLHVRRSLKKIRKMVQVEKIVDPVVKSLVKHAAIQYSNGSSVFSKYTFFEEMIDGRLESKVFLQNKNGDKVPVRKVRMREAFSTKVQLKKGVNTFVVPRKNHHILIFKNKEGEINEEVVSFWEAVERFKNNMPVYSQFNKDEGEVLAIMEINDLFLLGADKLDENLELESRAYLMKHLYRVQKLSTRYYEFRLAYKCVSTSLETPDYIRINGFGDRKTGWLKYNPVKVKLSVTGQIKKI